MGAGAQKVPTGHTFRMIIEFEPPLDASGAAYLGFKGAVDELADGADGDWAEKPPGGSKISGGTITILGHKKLEVVRGFALGVNRLLRAVRTQKAKDGKIIGVDQLAQVVKNLDHSGNEVPPIADNA